MNYHSDEWIMERVKEHYDEALKHFPEDRIIGLFLQGSQNYQLDTSTSDIDTKLIVTPTLKDIAMNRNPISTTHVRANNEHIDFKDVRLYLQTFRKQNLNFLEILYTPYCIVNQLYKDEWNRLIDHREEITHYNPVQALKAMTGTARTKYKQLENESPSHIEAVKKFGYSPKEFCHLLRIEEFIQRYISGESYDKCIVTQMPNLLKNAKAGKIDLDVARYVAEIAMQHIEEMCDEFVESGEHTVDESVNKLLDDVQYNIMRIAISKELLGVK